MDTFRLLLVFVKNPERGKVKTRLAATLGPDRALGVYKKLLSHTINAASQTNAVREVWYSSFVDENDTIPPDFFDKKLQPQGNLGAKMAYAFREGFENGFSKVVIIGSDCPGISSGLLEEAYRELDKHDLVIGPSKDGGYYLLGMNRYLPELFENIEWSTDRVLPVTLKRAKSLSLTVGLLAELNDIDTEEDLQHSSFNI